MQVVLWLLTLFFFFIGYRFVPTQLLDGFFSWAASYSAPELIFGHYLAYHGGCDRRTKCQWLFYIQFTGKLIQRVSQSLVTDCHSVSTFISDYSWKQSSTCVWEHSLSILFLVHLPYQWDLRQDFASGGSRQAFSLQHCLFKSLNLHFEDCALRNVYEMQRFCTAGFSLRLQSLQHKRAGLQDVWGRCLSQVLGAALCWHNNSLVCGSRPPAV